MKIRPLNNHVFIAISDDQNRKTRSGLFIPDSAHEDKLIRARVVAVGAGRWSETSGVRETIDLKPGQIVLVDDAILNIKQFPAWQLRAYENTKDGEKLFLVQADAIRAEDEEATAAASSAEAAE